MIEDILQGLNPAQREAVENFEGPSLIIAGAGSGKTMILLHRLSYLAFNNRYKSYDNIKIITRRFSIILFSSSFIIYNTILLSW